MENTHTAVAFQHIKPWNANNKPNQKINLETVHSRQQGSYFENGYVRFYAVDPEIPNHSTFHWSSLYAPEVGMLITLVLPKRRTQELSHLLRPHNILPRAIYLKVVWRIES